MRDRRGHFAKIIDAGEMREFVLKGAKPFAGFVPVGDVRHNADQPPSGTRFRTGELISARIRLGGP